MILVDANLLLYAEDALSPRHEAARRAGSINRACGWSILSTAIEACCKHCSGRDKRSETWSRMRTSRRSRFSTAAR